MEIPTISPMLAFYGSEAASYQPTRPGMQFNLEDGNPQASLENLKRLKLTVKCFWVRKQATRVLIHSSTESSMLPSDCPIRGL